MDRSVSWDDEKKAVKLINQPLLPTEYAVVSYGSVAGVSKAIRDMVVRGAPAIGAAGALGMAVAAFQCGAVGDVEAALGAAKSELDQARPTAVNLEWATGRMMTFFREVVMPIQHDLPCRCAVGSAGGSCPANRMEIKKDGQAWICLCARGSQHSSIATQDPV